jgi:hypothetical protein
MEDKCRKCGGLMRDSYDQEKHPDKRVCTECFDIIRVRPTPEELHDAIERHVKKSAERVAKIPYKNRTILSRDEADRVKKTD